MENPFQSQPGAAPDRPPGAGSADQLPCSSWSVRGVEDVYYQREAQIGWWTVLGGIAIGALLTQLSAVVSQVQAGRWSLLLYFAATALIIALSWVMAAWGPLVVRWRISVAMALLHLFHGLMLSVLSLQVTSPPAWYFANCLVILSSVCNQIYLARSGAWAVFSAGYVARLRGVAWIHGALDVAALIAALLLLRYPGRLHETVWGVMAILVAVFALWLQDQGMKAERAALGIP